MIRQVNSPSLVLLPPISVKVTGKAFIFRGVARRLMTVSVKVTAKAFIFRDVARRLMTVRRTSPGQARWVRGIPT